MEQVDKEIHEALMASTDGLDLDLCLRIVNKAVHAMEKMAESLMNASYDPEKFEATARSLAQTGKMLSEVYRLMQFSKGEVDSRTGIQSTSTDWLDMLTDEQLNQLRAWVRDGEAREKAEG